MFCSNCKFPIGLVDRYCTNCGHSLFKIAFIDDEGQEIKAKSIEKSIHSTEISLKNIGPNPLGIHLDNTVLKQESKWLDAKKTFENHPQPTTLNQITSEIFRIDFIHSILAKKLHDLSSITEADGKITLSFYSSHIVFDPQTGFWDYDTLRFDIFLSQPPFLRPEYMVFRYLWWESLQNTKNKISLPVDLCNFSSDTITIYNIQTEDDTGSIPFEVTFDISQDKIQAIKRIPIADIIDISDYKDIHSRVISREKQHLKIPLKSNYHNGELVRFSGSVLVYLDKQDDPISAQIGGIIGRAPRVEVLNWEQLITELLIPISIQVHNPGHLPITVNGYSLFRSNPNKENLEPIESLENDWLTLTDFPKKEFQLGPMETRIFRAKIDVSKRDIQFDRAEYGFRNIVIHHTTDEHFPCIIPLQVRIGHIERTGYIGIDFGTTNSVVCFTNPLEDAFNFDLQQLQIAPRRTDKKLEQLRSLLFYTSESTQSYLFGEDALSRSGLAPHNLIRSMKTVVNKNPDEIIAFIHNDSENRFLKHVRVQELLNEFILELKRRSESCLTNLSDARKDELSLSGNTNIQVQNAIFTHPVDINDTALNALFLAAQACGFNIHEESLEDFKSNSCIDESTAALISFIHHSDQGGFSTISNIQSTLEKDIINILCIDIGGGTTDITTASLERDHDFNMIKILRSYGDAHFGGDNIDKLIADYILSELNSDHRIADIATALEYYTLESFTRFLVNQEQKTHSNISQAQLEEIQENARQIFSNSQKLRSRAEIAKIILSKEKKATVNVADLGVSPPQVELSQRWFNDYLKGEISRLMPLIQKSLRNSYWAPSDLDILLFTGQTSRLKELRNYFMNALKSLDSKCHFIVIDPDNTSFDPKSCVSEGAIIYRQWLSNDLVSIDDFRPDIPLDNNRPKVLAVDILRSRNPKAKAIKGLESNTPFPAHASLGFKKPRKQINLYRRGESIPFLFIEFEHPIHTLNLTFTNLNEITAEGIHNTETITGMVKQP